MICTAQLARMHRPTARVATQHVAMVSTARRPVHVTPCHGCATFRWRGVHAGDSTALKASERALGAHRSLARRAVTLGSRTCWIEGRKRLSQHRPRGALVRPLVTRALTSNDVDHASYIQDNAAIPAPQLLPMLVKVLEARGQTVLSPADRKGLHPLVVPLSRAAGGDTLTGVLRWPTSAGGDDMPIVEAGPHGLSLLANSCSEYIHRALVEEDLTVGADGPVRAAAGMEASTLYAAGSISKDQRLEVYLVQKVGKFPDVMEGLARGHLAKGDTEANITSALVTAEWMAGNMPGWGRAAAFHSMLLSELGRHDESRDQARIALCSPWWTLGTSYSQVVELAGYADKEPAWVRDALLGEMTLRDAQLKGNAPPPQQQKTEEELALEDAEVLLDMAAVSGDWDAIRGQLVSKYMKAGLNKLAFFVQAVGAPST